jgi:hypothetical protein
LVEHSFGECRGSERFASGAVAKKKQSSVLAQLRSRSSAPEFLKRPAYAGLKAFRSVNAPMEQSVARTRFQQAGLPIEKLEEFEQLRSAMERTFAAGAVEGFLRLLQRKGVPIRDFDRVLREKMFEQVDETLGRSGKTARQLYEALTVNDQAQIREFYLTTLEVVDSPLRQKFNKLYRYY